MLISKLNITSVSKNGTILEEDKRSKLLPYNVVVLVEDNPLIAKVALFKLAKLIDFTQLVWIKSGQAALEAFEGKPFEGYGVILHRVPTNRMQLVSSVYTLVQGACLVLMDFDLGFDVKGSDIAQRIRYWESKHGWPYIHILTFTSHYIRGSQLNSGDSLVFDGILPKPFKANELKIALAPYLSTCLKLIDSNKQMEMNTCTQAPDSCIPANKI